MSIIAVTVLMRCNGDRLTLADGDKALAAIGKAQGDVTFRPVNIVCAQSQLALQ